MRKNLSAMQRMILFACLVTTAVRNCKWWWVLCKNVLQKTNFLQYIAFTMPWFHIDLSLGRLPDPSGGDVQAAEQVAWPTPQRQQYTSCWPLGMNRHAWTLGMTLCPRWLCI